MLGPGAGAGGRGAGASAEGQKSTGIENYSTAAERGRSAAAGCGVLAAGCWLLAAGWEARVAVSGPGSGKASVSWFLLGAAAGPRAGGRVGLGCFTGLFYKRGRKKNKSLRRRRRGFFVNFFWVF